MFLKGCGGGGNCGFTSSSSGQVRFIFYNSNNQLATDFNINHIDFTIETPCNNKFSSSIVRAAGDFNSWLTTDPDTQMYLNSSICAYVLNLSGLKPNAIYQWKVFRGRKLINDAS